MKKNVTRHAYLIMAHNNFGLLEKLISLLDHNNNDIYLHMDVKANYNKYSGLKKIIKKSKLYILDEMNINWGDFTQVECELNLLKKAVKNNYDYYHLISGVDLPLRPQSYIHEFFDKNKGKEFIHFQSPSPSLNTIDRVNYYYFLLPFYKKSKSKFINIMFYYFESISVEIQKLIGVQRYKGDYTLQKGANWFSITNELACYVLNNKEWIVKKFKHTANPDESFLQTLVINSDFKDNLFSKTYDDSYYSCQRLIDWNRGEPYTWKKEDFEELVNSQFLFARKFDEKVDKEIIEKIYYYLIRK